MTRPYGPVYKEGAGPTPPTAPDGFTVNEWQVMKARASGDRHMLRVVSLPEWADDRCRVCRHGRRCLRTDRHAGGCTFSLCLT